MYRKIESSVIFLLDISMELSYVARTVAVSLTEEPETDTGAVYKRT